MIGFDCRTQTGAPICAPAGERRGGAARSIVIASGVKLPAPRRRESGHLRKRQRSLLGLARSKRALCADQEVVLVGGGNSAGQAAVFLPGMSRRSGCWCAATNRCDHVALSGRPCQRAAQYRSAPSDRSLCARRRRWHARRRCTGAHADRRKVRRPAPQLFLFIGADPNTGWLKGSGVALDPKGFVLTGADAGESPLARDQPARRLCHRRYPRGLDQAGRGRRRRRRAGGRSPARLSRCAEAGRGSACRGTREAAGVIVIANAPRPG